MEIMGIEEQRKAKGKEDGLDRVKGGRWARGMSETASVRVQREWNTVTSVSEVMKWFVTTTAVEESEELKTSAVITQVLIMINEYNVVVK